MHCAMEAEWASLMAGSKRPGDQVFPWLDWTTISTLGRRPRLPPYFHQASRPGTRVSETRLFLTFHLDQVAHGAEAWPLHIPRRRSRHWTACATQTPEGQRHGPVSPAILELPRQYSSWHLGRIDVRTPGPSVIGRFVDEASPHHLQTPRPRPGSRTRSRCAKSPDGCRQSANDLHPCHAAHLKSKKKTVEGSRRLLHHRPVSGVVGISGVIPVRRDSTVAGCHRDDDIYRCIQSPRGHHDHPLTRPLRQLDENRISDWSCRRYSCGGS